MTGDVELATGVSVAAMYLTRLFAVALAMSAACCALASVADTAMITVLGTTEADTCLDRSSAVVPSFRVVTTGCRTAG